MCAGAWSDAAAHTSIAAAAVGLACDGASATHQCGLAHLGVEHNGAHDPGVGHGNAQSVQRPLRVHAYITQPCARVIGISVHAGRGRAHAMGGEVGCTRCWTALVAPQPPMPPHLVVLVGTVREVEARNGHASAQQLLQHRHITALGAERADDLKAGGCCDGALAGPACATAANCNAQSLS
jgi:hypothetical protein